MTEGQKFKAKNGYSKTTKRLLNKYKIPTEDKETVLNTLRSIQRAWRKKQKLTKKKKHAEAQEYMRTKGKTRKSKHKGRTKGNGGRGGVQKKKVEN